MTAMTLEDIFHEAGAQSTLTELRLIGRQRVLFVASRPAGHVLKRNRSERMKRQSDGSYRGEETGWRIKRERGKRWQAQH
jgi:hypothetical protein